MYNNFDNCGCGCDNGFGGPVMGAVSGPMGGPGSPLIDQLCNNIGRVVTIFTASGGVSGSGFTGLLVWANNNAVKLVTNLPSAPANPLGDCGCNNGLFWNSNYCGNSTNGSSVIIPTCQIVSFVFTEI